MDEFLFISMAKLGADRLTKERQDRGARPLATPRDFRATVARVQTQRSPAAQVAVVNTPLAVFSLAFAIGLGIAGLGWYASVREPLPHGEVYVTELDANGQPSDVTMAQNAVAPSITR
jgi:hypothetical protein